MADSTKLGNSIDIQPSEVLNTIRKYMLVDGFPIVVDLETSQGSRLVDKATGKSYLDFFQFFASMPLGFNHPRLTDADFKRRLADVAVNKPSNSDFYAKQMADFVEAMGRHAIPKEMTHMFLISGGALAVENALKVAFDWKVRKNRAKGIQGNVGQKIIHFREAFHGRTGYTMSMTNTDPTKTDYYPQFDWPRITNPKVVFPIDSHLDQVTAAEEKAKAELQAAIERDGDDIAALIIEPIQGEGGDNHFRAEFLQYLRRVTEENEILFICDEVQTGVGLTGSFWAYEQFGIVPDVVAFGKKMQVCGVLATDRVDDVDNVFKIPGRINSTWGGNLTDMFRATRYLEVIAEDNLVDNARKTGEYLLSKLEEMQGRNSGLVSNARGRGLMAAFDLPDGDTRGKALTTCKENGVLMVGCGPRSIRFRPPLTLTRDEVDEGVEVIERSLGTL